MAVHYVSPQTDLTALIASDAVQPGDVLLLEDGIYSQSVLIAKNNVRITAKGRCAIFDGGNTLANGFTLDNTIGVEIHGLALRNYTASGVTISSGYGNFIAGNTMCNLGLGGVRALTTAANVIWGNSFANTYDGVIMAQSSSFNWVLENSAKNSLWDGFESFLSEDSANVFVGNTAVSSQEYGYELFGANSLAFGNEARSCSASGYYLAAGFNSAALRNRSACNGLDGISLNSGNGFAAANELTDNIRSGAEVRSNAGIVANNYAARNRFYGIGVLSNMNFIFRNLFTDNAPQDILDNGEDNNFVGNRLTEDPCKTPKPCAGCAQPWPWEQSRCAAV